MCRPQSSRHIPCAVQPESWHQLDCERHGGACLLLLSERHGGACLLRLSERHGGACYFCRLCLLRKILLGSLSKSNGLFVSHLHERFVKPPVDPDIAFVCNLDRSLLQFVL